MNACAPNHPETSATRGAQSVSSDTRDLVSGMTLEPVQGAASDGPSAELLAMTRRLWVGAALSVPLLVLEIGAHFPGLKLQRMVVGHTRIVPRLVRELQFNGLMRPPLFMRDGRRPAAEAMSRHLASVTHPI